MNASGSELLIRTALLNVSAGDIHPPSPYREHTVRHRYDSDDSHSAGRVDGDIQAILS